MYIVFRYSEFDGVPITVTKLENVHFKVFSNAKDANNYIIADYEDMKSKFFTYHDYRSKLYNADLYKQVLSNIVTKFSSPVNSNNYKLNWLRYYVEDKNETETNSNV